MGCNVWGGGVWGAGVWGDFCFALGTVGGQLVIAVVIGGELFVT